MANKRESLLEALTLEEVACIIDTVNSGELDADAQVIVLKRSFIEDEATVAAMKAESHKQPCCSGPRMSAGFMGRNVVRNAVGRID